jgi:hypothetical protein
LEEAAFKGILKEIISKTGGVEDDPALRGSHQANGMVGKF